MEIRLLAKNTPDNRLRIARAGAIKPLISQISSSNLQLQEHGVTAILNPQVISNRRKQIRDRTVRSDFVTSKPSRNESIHGKKDALTALYCLCSVKENKIRVVQAGIMKPFVEIMANFMSNMVDKAAFVMSIWVTTAEARATLVEEGGISVLVEIIKVGSQRRKEIAVVILLQICDESAVYHTMVAREEDGLMSLKRENQIHTTISGRLIGKDDMRILNLGFLFSRKGKIVFFSSQGV